MSVSIIDLSAQKDRPQNAVKELLFFVASERARGARVVKAVCPPDKSCRTAVRRAVKRLKTEGRIVCYAWGGEYDTRSPDVLYMQDKVPELIGDADLGAGREELAVLFLG